MDRLDRDARIALIDARDADALAGARQSAAWSRLQAAIAAGEEPVTAGEPLAAERRRPAYGWKIAVLLAAAAVLLLVGLDAVVGRRAPDDRGQQAAHGEVAPDDQELQVRRPAPVGAATMTSPLEHAPMDRPEEAAVAPPLTPPAARPSQPDEHDVDIVAELALLRRARAALAAGQTDSALALLAEHAQRFAGGHLAEERTSLRVQALCAAGSRDAARAEAEAFVRANPASPHARKLLRVCDEP